MSDLELASRPDPTTPKEPDDAVSSRTDALDLLVQSVAREAVLRDLIGTITRASRNVYLSADNEREVALAAAIKDAGDALEYAANGLAAGLVWRHDALLNIVEAVRQGRDDPNGIDEGWLSQALSRLRYAEREPSVQRWADVTRRGLRFAVGLVFFCP